MLKRSILASKLFYFVQALQQRMLEDEIALCDKKIQTILNGMFFFHCCFALLAYFVELVHYSIIIFFSYFSILLFLRIILSSFIF